MTRPSCLQLARLPALRNLFGMTQEALAIGGSDGVARTVRSACVMMCRSAMVHQLLLVRYYSQDRIADGRSTAVSSLRSPQKDARSF